MKFLKITSIASFIFFLSFGFSANSQELHGILCGGEIRQADMDVAAEFESANPGVTIKWEAVPWGTCQDKVINLAIAGDPVDLAYVGSRTLKGLAENGHIINVDIPQSQIDMYQPGILNTVSHLGKVWGYPRAFSTKALFKLVKP